MTKAMMMIFFHFNFQGQAPNVCCFCICCFRCSCRYLLRCLRCFCFCCRCCCCWSSSSSIAATQAVKMSSKFLAKIDCEDDYEVTKTHWRRLHATRTHMPASTWKPSIDVWHVECSGTYDVCCNRCLKRWNHSRNHPSINPLHSEPMRKY